MFLDRVEVFALTLTAASFDNGPVCRVSLHSGGLLHRAALDNNADLKKFCETLEKVCIDTIESGFMTKDLAICVKGSMSAVQKGDYLETFAFMDKLADNLKKALA